MDLSPRRSDLKQATSQAHQALDDLIGAFVTAEDYARYLEGMARFRLPVEAWLATQPLPTGFEEWQPGLYGEELIDDLHVLGLTPPDELAAFTPPPGDGLLGLLYVLEGSALGARLLAKRAEAIGFTETKGARHLFAQARNFSNWRAFSDRMENVCVYDDRAAAAWADTAFDYARNAFESVLNANRAYRRPVELRP
ncbi:heme oxygenase [Rhizobium sp. Root274]|uniref:biliverdin-producing heme oxygenase n=1 Tax=unclassified Rhizobium TaxID=2613769 RepID=UPI0007126DB8|nr:MULTISPECIES: biliverdin-producing heme oxygenase [unclassified Rhizobium]KQW29179.1 heme oxygenase [Rhizobium sp. Root1240]KRD29375.1 heme oxygenase [Rhizobium sp. Root274]